MTELLNVSGETNETSNEELMEDITKEISFSQDTPNIFRDINMAKRAKEEDGDFDDDEFKEEEEEDDELEDDFLEEEPSEEDFYEEDFDFEEDDDDLIDEEEQF